MELWQAALIGLFAYLGRNQVPWLIGTSGGWYGIDRPLVAGTIVGVILGDVGAGVLAGVAVQAIFLGQITPGGAVPSDLNLASWVGIPLAIVAGGTPETAVALAIPFGAIGVGLHNLCMTVNAAFAHRGDRYAAAGDAAGVRRANVSATLVHFTERFGIVTAVCFFGAGVAQQIVSALPQGVLHYLQVAGTMLPALGFAILLNQIVREKWMLILFVLGWVLFSSLGITTTALVLIAVAIALLYVMARYGLGKADAGDVALAMSAQRPRSGALAESDEYDE